MAIILKISKLVLTHNFHICSQKTTAVLFRNGGSSNILPVIKYNDELIVGR